jgi:hypothetical protein
VLHYYLFFALSASTPVTVVEFSGPITCDAALERLAQVSPAPLFAFCVTR